MPSWSMIHGTSTWNSYTSINNLPHRQMAYKPATAYTAVQPVLVNGVDINTGPYPILNFQPEGTTVPYIYVPIAEFSRVGATVNWNEEAQLLSVVTDYFTDKSRMADYKEKLDIVEKGLGEKLSSDEMQFFTYEGKMEGMNWYQINGHFWRKSSDKAEIGFKPGKSYRGLLDVDPVRTTYWNARLMLIDDNGKPITFSTYLNT